MKIICTQENLNKALSIVGKVVNKNTTLPILNNVLLKTDKKGLQLSSTNLEIAVNYWIGGKTEEDGEITVPTKLFANFISNLPNGNVEIKTREDMVNIKCNGYKINIKGVDAREYPLSPKIDAVPFLKIKSEIFKRALSQVIPAISVSESRMEITGVLLDLSEIKKNKIVLVSTDSYRLAEKTLKVSPENVSQEALEVLGDLKSVIIPRSTVQELVRDLGEGDEMLDIIISENQIVFTFGSANILSRLIEGRYPDYRQIVPEKFMANAIINVKDITNAVRISGFFSASSNNSVKFLLSADNKVEISSEASEIGNNNAKIEAKITGKDLEVVYNYKYLMDGLNSIIGDEVVLDANDENAPSVIKSVKDDSFIYIIMPIRG
ncbi:MAG: DNA polymerase III subunit beta [Candidatus Pacebacteria bacterium]|nr:DNA polymerase III subunit beta [Candidatus Paceibacterota bacterium]